MLLPKLWRNITYDIWYVSAMMMPMIGLGTLQKEAVGLAFVSWDYVILDEGHKIKNPKNQISRAIANIPSHHKLLLTGTPIMNNLRVRILPLMLSLLTFFYCVDTLLIPF